MKQSVMFILILLDAVVTNHAYLPVDSNVRSSVHGKILRDGLLYLQHILQGAPGLNDTLTTALQEEESLYRGLHIADFETGKLSILGGEWSRNELSHFYNPTTQQGYQVGKYVSWIRQLQRRGWLTKEASLLLGPTISSADMVDWYYSRAIHVARSNMTEALESLGYAAHMVMDATVPQHATDCGDENTRCGHRRYEEYVEKRYDDWELTVFHDVMNAYMSTSEVQQLAGKTAGDIVRYGALQSQPLFDLVDRGASDDNMEAASEFLVPLAQQLVATLVLLFLADYRSSFAYQEAVVLQILSVELDGDWSENSQADFKPIVTSGSIPRKETRGYIAGSNFAYLNGAISSHAWSFVQTIERSLFTNMEQPVATFQLEIHDVAADGCGGNCGKSQQTLLVATGGRTSIEISLPLDNLSREAAIEGSSTGCDMAQLKIDNCKNAIKVTWRIGRSFLMKGQTEELQTSSLTFYDFITSSGLWAIVFSFLSFLLLFAGFVGIFVFLIRRFKSRTGRNSYKKAEVDNPYLVEDQLDDTRFPDNNSDRLKASIDDWHPTHNAETEEASEEGRDLVSPMLWPLPKFEENINFIESRVEENCVPLESSASRSSMASSSDLANIPRSLSLDDSFQRRNSGSIAPGQLVPQRPSTSDLALQASERIDSMRRKSSADLGSGLQRLELSADSPLPGQLPANSNSLNRDPTFTCHNGLYNHDIHHLPDVTAPSSNPKIHPPIRSGSMPTIIQQQPSIDLASERINSTHKKPSPDVNNFLYRWEMLDDNTLPEEPPSISHPLNLDSDLTGQHIIVSRQASRFRFQALQHNHNKGQSFKDS